MTTDTIDFADTELRMALRWRFGLSMPAGTCRCTPTNGGERCGAPICSRGVHCLSCMVGPTRYSLHHSAADRLCCFVEETGAKSRREAFVPEFLDGRRAKHPADVKNDDDEEQRRFAVLDVWGFGSIEVSDLLVDVTFRNAAAPKYAPRAADMPGWTCQCAEAEKQERYPPRSGRRVQTLAIESWGRVGAEGEALLLSLRAAADQRDLRNGRAPTGRLQRWCQQLDVIVQRGIARCLEASLTGLPGQAQRCKS